MSSGHVPGGLASGTMLLMRPERDTTILVPQGTLRVNSRMSSDARLRPLAPPPMPRPVVGSGLGLPMEVSTA